MSTIIICREEWTGSAEQIEAVRQYARDYDWSGPIEDPEHAADVLASELTAEIDTHPEAESLLRASLVDAAARARGAL